jgi:L-2-hydroxyglutarate oxidase LhgO
MSISKKESVKCAMVEIESQLLASDLLGYPHSLPFKIHTRGLFDTLTAEINASFSGRVYLIPTSAGEPLTVTVLCLPKATTIRTGVRPNQEELADFHKSVGITKASDLVATVSVPTAVVKKLPKNMTVEQVGKNRDLQAYMTPSAKKITKLAEESSKPAKKRKSVA